MRIKIIKIFLVFILIFENLFGGLITHNITFALPPIANPDTFIINEDTASNLSVLLNDSDPESQSFVLTGVITALHGVGTLSGDTQIRYTPTANYCGSETLTYHSVDSSGELSNTGNVSMTINCINDAPYIDTSHYILDANTSMSGTILGRDVDGDVVNIQILGGTANGVLSYTSGSASFSYTPNYGFAGEDSFPIVYSDGIVSLSGTIYLTILNTQVAASGSSIQDLGLLGGNLGGFHDWDILRYYVDEIYQARGFGYSNTYAFSGNILGANGWPNQASEIVWRAGGSNPEIGTYKGSFSGSANISTIGFGISNKVFSGGITTFDINVTADNNLIFRFDAPIESLKIIPPSYIGRVPQKWRDETILYLKSFSSLRLMDLASTNSNSQTTWGSRPTPSMIGQFTTYGIPWEELIDLANTTHNASGSRMNTIWINIPAMADDAYITNLAILFRDTLDPNIKIYVELSNETWNWQFSQTKHFHDLAKTEALANTGSNLRWNNSTSEWDWWHRIYARRVMEMSHLFATVYGPSGFGNRYRPVLAGQLIGVYFMKDMLDYLHNVYNTESINSYIYYISVAVYSGMSDSEFKNATSGADYLNWLNNDIINLSSSIEEFLNLGRLYNIHSTAYEGGPHLHLTYHNDYVITATYAADMRKHIQALLQKWFTYGGQEYFYYNLSPAICTGGNSCWGIMDSLSSQSNAKYQGFYNTLIGKIPTYRNKHGNPGTSAAKDYAFADSTTRGPWDFTAQPGQNIVIEASGSINRWMDYSFAIPQSGIYRFTVKGNKAGPSSNVNITTSGSLLGSVPFPGGYSPASQTGVTLPTFDAYLDKGFHLIRLEFPLETNQFGITSIGLTAFNLPAVAVVDTIAMNEDTIGQVISPLTNDTDPDGDNISIDHLIQGAMHGIATMSGTTEIVYTPTGNYCGTDSLIYQLIDNRGLLGGTGAVNIQISCINDNPIAQDDTMSVTGSTLQFDPTLNDTDPDSPYYGQTFTVTGNTLPNHGSINFITSTLLEYTPIVGYSGTDLFTYQIIDQSGAISNSSTVTLGVTGLNVAPMGSGMTYITPEDTVLNNSLSGSDANGDILSFTISTLPIHGIVVLGRGGANTMPFTYTPIANYFGNDSFIYRVFDGQTYSPDSTINLQISPIADIPVGVNDTFTTLVDTRVFLGVMANDTDADSSPSNLTLTGLVQPLHGSIVISGSGLIYTPNSGYSGADNASYQILDETNNLSNITTVTLTVSSINSAPISSGSILFATEDIPLTETLLASDPEHSTLTYTIDSLPTHGTLTLSGIGNFQYTPVTNYFGTDSFSFHVNDGIMDSNTSIIDINIAGVNDIPTVTSGIASLVGNTSGNSGNTYTGQLIGNDVEDISLTYVIDNLPIHGILSNNSGGSYIYTPAINYFGTDSFGFHTVDSNNTSSLTGTIALTITNMNSAPIAQTGSINISEDTQVTNGSLSGTDINHDTLTYILNTNTQYGILQLTASGGFQYTPQTNYFGTDSFSFHVNDGIIGSSIVTYTIQVSPINDQPIASNLFYTLTGNTTSQSGNLIQASLTGSDIENTTLSYSLVSTPSHGVTILGSGGVFTYTPSIGYVGSDTFTYTVSDGLLTSTLATTTFNVLSPTRVTSAGANTENNISPGVGGSSSSTTMNIADLNSRNSASVNSASRFGELLLGQVFARSLVQDLVIPISLGTLHQTTDVVENLIQKLQVVYIESVKSNHSPIFTTNIDKIRKIGRELQKTIEQKTNLKIEKQKIIKEAIRSIQSSIATNIPNKEKGALNYVIRILKQGIYK